jgi:predicted RNase H-like HicB family nuclease
MSEHRNLVCIVTGRANDWEAFCLDFDLAVQGGSFEEVRLSLNHAIEMYLNDALAEPEPEPIRSRLLARCVPFFVRLMWAWRMFPRKQIRALTKNTVSRI